MLLLWDFGLFFFGASVYSSLGLWSTHCSLGLWSYSSLGLRSYFGMGEYIFFKDVPDKAEKMSKFLFVDIFLNISI